MSQFGRRDIPVVPLADQPVRVADAPSPIFQQAQQALSAALGLTGSITQEQLAQEKFKGQQAEMAHRANMQEIALDTLKQRAIATEKRIEIANANLQSDEAKRKLEDLIRRELSDVTERTVGMTPDERVDYLAKYRWYSEANRRTVADSLGINMASTMYNNYVVGGLVEHVAGGHDPNDYRASVAAERALAAFREMGPDPLSIDSFEKHLTTLTERFDAAVAKDRIDRLAAGATNALTRSIYLELQAAVETPDPDGLAAYLNSALSRAAQLPDADGDEGFAGNYVAKAYLDAVSARLSLFEADPNDPGNDVSGMIAAMDGLDTDSDIGKLLETYRVPRAIHSAYEKALNGVQAKAASDINSLETALHSIITDAVTGDDLDAARSSKVNTTIDKLLKGKYITPEIAAAITEKRTAMFASRLAQIEAAEAQVNPVLNAIRTGIIPDDPIALSDLALRQLRNYFGDSRIPEYIGALMTYTTATGVDESVAKDVQHLIQTGQIAVVSRIFALAYNREAQQPDGVQESWTQTIFNSPEGQAMLTLFRMEASQGLPAGSLASDITTYASEFAGAYVETNKYANGKKYIKETQEDGTTVPKLNPLGSQEVHGISVLSLGVGDTRNTYRVLAAMELAKLIGTGAGGTERELIKQAGEQAAVKMEAMFSKINEALVPNWVLWGFGNNSIRPNPDALHKRVLNAAQDQYQIDENFWGRYAKGVKWEGSFRSVGVGTESLDVLYVPIWTDDEQLVFAAVDGPKIDLIGPGDKGHHELMMTNRRNPYAQLGPLSTYYKSDRDWPGTVEEHNPQWMTDIRAWALQRVATMGMEYGSREHAIYAAMLEEQMATRLGWNGLENLTRGDQTDER